MTTRYAAIRTIFRSFLLAALLALPVGFAQGFYIGAIVGTPITGTVTSVTDAAELGAQIGIDFIPNVGLRLAAEGNPLNGGLKLGGGDLIIRTFLPLTYNNFYAGLGADVLYATQPASVDELSDGNLVAHALVGGELRLANVGLFAELIPNYFVGANPTSRSAYFLRARGGVNYHF